MTTMIKLKVLGIAVLLLVSSASVVLADPPPPPGPGGSPVSGGGTPVGAPIDGGLGILLAMGSAYGARKFYKARKHKNEKEDKVELMDT